MLLRRRISASSAFSALDSARSCARFPPCQALRDTRALPSAVLGPVDCSHGFQLLIKLAWRCLRSGDHPVVMFRLRFQ